MMCYQYIQGGFSNKLAFADKPHALMKSKNAFSKRKTKNIQSDFDKVNVSAFQPHNYFLQLSPVHFPRALALNYLSYTWCRMAGFCQGHRGTKCCSGCEMSSRMPTTASGWCHMSTTGLDAAWFFNDCVMCMLQMREKKSMDVTTKKRFGQIQQGDEVIHYL